jgi:hypothetical protein
MKKIEQELAFSGVQLPDAMAAINLKRDRLRLLLSQGMMTFADAAQEYEAVCSLNDGTHAQPWMDTPEYSETVARLNAAVAAGKFSNSKAFDELLKVEEASRIEQSDHSAQEKI